MIRLFTLKSGFTYVCSKYLGQTFMLDSTYLKTKPFECLVR
jgi:hypothetical protein